MLTSSPTALPAAPVPVLPGAPETSPLATVLLPKDADPDGDCALPWDQLVQQLSADPEFCRELLKRFNERQK